MKKKIFAVLCTVCILAVSFNLMIAPFAVSASQDSTTLVDIDYITSAKTGNIFAVTDTIEFRQIITNKANESVVSKYSWDITDEAGASVTTYSDTDELGSHVAKTRRITINNPGKYGIYTINVTEENYTKANPGTKYTTQYSDEFSICISLDSSNVDEHFGFNQSVVRGLGDTTKSSSLMHNAGAKWNRESIMWVGVESTTTKGSYNMSGATLDKVDAELNSGINLVGVITGRHPLYGNGGTQNPNTNEDIAAFAAMCGFVAGTLEGRIEHFEIWNEWNSSNFNPTMESPETYAKVLKAAYTAIKAANPDATVIGCDVAGIDTAQITWIRRVLNALNGETAMDAISVHCYDYSATEGFPEMQFVNEASALKDLLAEYNLDIPVWLTETGFNTRNISTPGFVPACTKEVQLNSMVMLSAVNKAYELFDNVLQYCFHDMSNKSDIRANWGVVNCWQRDYTEYPEAKLLPNGAKPAYLGIAAMNYFIGGNTTFVNMIKNDRSYAFEFRNENLNKDVILAINGGISNYSTQELNLGCDSISIYDKYGNLKNQMSSQTGSYSIDTYPDPIYIVGDFTSFEVYHTNISLSASVDINNNMVTITGNTSEPDDLVSVVIVTKGAELTSYDASRVQYLAQTASDGAGDFTVQYKTDSLAGTYQIYANSIKRRSKVITDLVFNYTIPDVSVTNNNQPVTDLSELTVGDRPVVKLTGFETTAEQSPKLIIAQYDGKYLNNVKFIDAVGSFTSLGNEFLTDFTVCDGTDRIKVMYWYMDSLTPIIAYYEII